MAIESAFHQPQDPAVIDAARRGETAAFAALFERYQRPCFNLALRVLGDRAAADDVVQEVFVRLFDAIRRFRGDAPFGAWLRRLIANATIDELRRRRWLASDEPLASAALPGADAQPEQRAEAWQLLSRLSPKARAVVVLHAIEGYTHRELAELFGQSESYSKSILARALTRLKTLDDDAPDAEDRDDERYYAAERPA